MMSPLDPRVALPGVCRTVLQVGISILIQSTLLLVLGLVGGGVLRRWGPALQSAIYRATLLGVVLGALLSVGSAGQLQSLWRISLPPAQGSERRPPSQETVAEGGGLGKTVPPRGSIAVAPTQAEAQPDRFGNGVGPPRLSRMTRIGWLYVAAVGLWSGGTLLLLAWLSLCHLHILRLRQRSAPVREGATVRSLWILAGLLRVRPPLLLASPQVSSPFLTHLGRPAIFLPASYETDFDDLAKRAILAHELIHLARSDCRWNLLARVVCAVGWTQPLLWALCHRLEQASEEVCDQEVLRHEFPPRAYANCLLSLAERLLPSRPERAAGVAVLPFRSSLGRRVQQILESSRRQAPPLSFRVRAMITLSTSLAAVLGPLLVSAAAAPPPDTAPQTKRSPGVTWVAAGADMQATELGRHLLGTLGPPFAVFLPAVQEDLKLSDEQKQKLRQAMIGAAQGLQEFVQHHEGLPRPAFENRLNEFRQGAHRTLGAFLAQILKPNQRQRFRQIVWQQEGLFALGSPDVAAELQLGDAQKMKFMAIVQETQKRFEALHQKAQSGGKPEEIQREAAKIRKEQEARVAALLTGAQKKQWKAMVGQPLKLAPSAGA